VKGARTGVKKLKSGRCASERTSVNERARERASERERERERENERKRERENERERASERASERERERRHKSIVVHGDTHMYTRANTWNYIQIHTRISKHKDTQYYIYTTP